MSLYPKSSDVADASYQVGGVFSFTVTRPRVPLRSRRGASAGRGYTTLSTPWPSLPGTPDPEPDVAPGTTKGADGTGLEWENPCALVEDVPEGQDRSREGSYVYTPHYKSSTGVTQSVGDGGGRETETGTMYGT